MGFPAAWRHYLPYAAPFILLLVLIVLGKLYGLLRRRGKAKRQLADADEEIVSREGRV